MAENLNKKQDNTYLLYNAGIFPYVKNSTLTASMVKAFSDILNLFWSNSDNKSITILKNFGLKLLNWIHEYVPGLFCDFCTANAKSTEIHNPKVMFYGDIKKHEIYFLILLSKLGTDVLYINTMAKDEFEDVDKHSRHSYVYKLPYTQPLEEFPRFKLQQKSNIIKSNTNTVIPPINYTPLETKKAENFAEKIHTAEKVEKTKKSLEELAQLSNSTVMIRTYDKNGKILGRGSGVVISNNGLIVTNYHVIEKGFYFGVIFEGMEENSQYETHTVINRNPDKDLALIKLPIKTNAIAISRGEDIARGQKVVAIGSPLGLMNTFSEGIISGFRKSQKCDFIQTTAPMSPGSSGGALLNMYGELIGVASAGFIDGQNINLAVPSKYVLDMLEEKSTVIGMELMEMYSSFSYNNIRINFDGLFGRSIVGCYNILLYQSRTDRTNLLELVKNRDFSNTLVNYYINIISNLMSKHSIQVYELQLGAGNYIFTYSYRKGKITNKGWEYINL